MTVVKTVIDGLHRDTESNALVSQDVNAFKMYKSNRKQNITLQSLHAQIQELRNEINSLKQHIKVGQ
jgi:archaellum component FlaC